MNQVHPFGRGENVPDEHPGDWTTHRTDTVFDQGGVRVDAVDVTAPAGDRFTEHVVHLHAAAIALVVEGDRVLTLWTYRHPTGLWGYELPGGGVDDGEDPAVAAEREAREETGLAPIGPGRPLIAFEPLPGFLTATVHVHVWEGAEGEVTEPTGEPRDPLEPGRVRWLPLAEVPGLAAEGRLLGSGTLVGLLQYLAERAGD